MSSPSSPEPRRVALLGSTGSIGRQVVQVVEAHPDAFRVVALATGHDRETLDEQAARLKPDVSVVGPSDAGLVELATRDDVDLVVVGTSGIVSLRPVLAALHAGKVVATANKETLVAGGHLVMPLARGLADTKLRRTGGKRSRSLAIRGGKYPAQLGVDYRILSAAKVDSETVRGG